MNLESNHSKYNRYKLLIAILDYTPINSEKRYVVIVLAIARTRGVETVIKVADQWLEHMCQDRG